jgi:hypothetical protein
MRNEVCHDERTEGCPGAKETVKPIHISGFVMDGRKVIESRVHKASAVPQHKRPGKKKNPEGNHAKAEKA